MQYNAFVETRKYYTSIQARGSLIADDIISAVKNHEDTEKTVPCVLGYTEIEGMISSVGVRVYLLHQNDLRELIADMGLEIASGRLPEPGKKEIVLHEAVIKNKNLSIGGLIGSDVAPGEKLLGKYRIVGALKGKALAGFASLEAWQMDTRVDRPEQYGILIYAKEGKLDELNRYLDYLPLQGNDLSSYSKSTSDLVKSSESIYIILNIIYISVLLIVSLCLGFLTYLFYRGRLKEFAILRIIGYSRQTILLRNIMEVIAVNAVSALGGIVCSILIGIVLNWTVFDAIGTPLLLFDAETLVWSLCVPMLCIAVQTLSIGLSLNKVDMVNIIELESGGVL